MARPITLKGLFASAIGTRQRIRHGAHHEDAQGRASKISLPDAFLAPFRKPVSKQVRKLLMLYIAFSRPKRS
jgi:hypothetical protein